MSEEKKVGSKIAEVVTGPNIQTYILGTKKNGQPRAAYDIVKDVMKMSKKGKKKKGKKGKKSGDEPVSTYEIYLASKKKRKKKKKSGHWHI